LLHLVLIFLAMTGYVYSYFKKSIAISLLSLLSISLFFQVSSQSLVVGGGIDGTYRSTKTPLEHPMTSSIYVSQDKANTLKFLTGKIKSGDSCFIYGASPTLYTLLGCKNPTLVDTMYSDFYTLEDAARVVDALQKNPPLWIIESSGVKRVDEKFDGTDVFYGHHRQEGPKLLHEAMIKLSSKYKSFGNMRSMLDSTDQHQIKDFDGVLDLTLFQRKV
jgi:hypothetical protein